MSSADPYYEQFRRQPRGDSVGYRDATSESTYRRAKRRSTMTDPHSLFRIDSGQMSSPRLMAQQQPHFAPYGGEGEGSTEKKRRPGDPMVDPSASTAALLGYAPGPARDFVAAQVEFDTRNPKMMELAHRVAGRLAFEYHGVLFQQLDVEADRYAADSELKAAQYGARLETYRAIESYARRSNPDYRPSAVEEEEETKSKTGKAPSGGSNPLVPPSTSSPPPPSNPEEEGEFDEVEATKMRIRRDEEYRRRSSTPQTFARMEALADMLSTASAQSDRRPQQRLSSSKSCATAMVVDPRAKTEPFPLGSTFAPKAFFVENVKHAAARIAEARNEGRNDPRYWENIVDTSDEVMYDDFAELVALSIVQSSQMLVNRILDRSKSFDVHVRMTIILDKFAVARRTDDGRLMCGRQSRRNEMESFDPVAEALNLVGYGGYSRGANFYPSTFSPMPASQYYYF